MTCLHDRSRCRAAVLAALLVLALGAASCGDDDDGGDSGGAAAQAQQGDVDPASFDNTPEGQIRAAHARLVNIIYSDNPERVCQHSSRKAQREWQGKSDSCEAGVKAFYDGALGLSKDRPRVLKVRIDGSRALAQTQVKGSNVYPSTFVKENGEWKLDQGSTR